MCRIYKDFIKKSISFMIVFSLLFSFIAPALTFAEDAPSVDATITVRIEGYKKTIIPPTEVNIKDLDLSDYPGIEKKAEDYNSLKPIHAIVKALEQNDIDPKDKNQFHVGWDGNYIHMIAGLREMEIGPMSGWMYHVNNQHVNQGVGDYKIEDGQEVVMFYIKDFNHIYSWFDQQSLNVNQHEDFTLKLNGGQGGSSIEGATILVNNEEYKKDGKAVKTNSKGEATFNIEEPGTYHISASLKNENGDITLVRPYASVKVNELITIKTIEEVEDIEVDFGTKKEKALSSLPSTTTIIDSQNKKHLVDLNWTLLDYKEDKAGDYDAFGTFILPQDVNQTRPETTLEIKTKVTVKEKPIPANLNLEEALNKTVQYYKDNVPSDPFSDWEAFVGLWGVGEDLSNKNYNWQSVDPGFDQIIFGNDHIRYIFSLLSIGEDPSNIWANRNLFAELSKHPEEYDAFGTIGKHIFAMKALDIGEALGADVENWNDENKAKAVQSLLKMQNTEGSFGSFSKLDHTGWALIALSKYKDQSRVQEAIDKALGYIESKQIESGSFVDTSGWGSGENSNTNACVIQGLIAVGEDVTDPNGRWTKNGNTPVDGLLQFQHEDGSFWWEKNNSGNVTMATKQSLVALVDLVNKKSTWNRMEEEIYLPSVGEEQVDKLNELISQLPIIENISLNDKNEIMKVYNMFMQLPDKYKEKVENKDILMKLKEKIEDIEREIKEINEAIWNLPGDVSEITLKHKPAILNIMARYDALSDEDKKHIEFYDEVLNAMKMIEKLEKENKTDISQDYKDKNTSKDIGTSINKDIKKDATKNIDSKIGQVVDTDKNPKTGDHQILIILFLFILSVSTLTIMGVIKKPSKDK